MRAGLQVFATDNGLGNQTRALYDHLRPAKTMLVDISKLNGLPLHRDWYRADVVTNGYPTNAEIERFLQGLDAVFLCETPLNFYLYERARQLGVAVICQHNWEFLDHLRDPRLPAPTLFAAPSAWHTDDLRTRNIAPVVDLPVPVNRDELPQRDITEANVFFHIAGIPAVQDRNGTHDFIAASKFARRRIPGATFIIYCQKPDATLRRAIHGTGIELIEELADYTDLYRRGDVLVQPRRYGGNSMPTQEAVGAGIPVLMPNISPNNAWLPSDWLFPVMPHRRQFMARTLIDVYSSHVPSISRKMVELHRNPAKVQAMAAAARRIGESISWKVLLPRYEEVIAQAVAMARNGL